MALKRKHDDDSIVNHDADRVEPYKHLSDITGKMHAKIYYPDGREYCDKFFKNEGKLINFLDGINFELEEEALYYAIVQ